MGRTILDLQPVSDDWLTDGFTGAMTISVDPDNVLAEGMGGGGDGQGGGPGGPPPDGAPGAPPAEATETTTA